MDPQRRRALRIVAWSALAGILLGALAWAWATRASPFLEEWRRLAAYGGWNGAKLAAIGALLLVAIALPLAIAEGRSMRRFRQVEARLRAERPDDLVTPYEGPEGRGVRFEGPGGVLLLLHPPGGLGAPRVVDATPPPPEESSATVTVDA